MYPVPVIVPFNNVVFFRSHRSGIAREVRLRNGLHFACASARPVRSVWRRAAMQLGFRFRDPLEKEPLGREKWVFRGLHAASALPFRLLVCYARAERLAPGSHGTERPWWWRSVGYGAVGARKVWCWGSVHAEPVFCIFGLFVWYVCGDGSVGWCFVCSAGEERL